MINPVVPGGTQPPKTQEGSMAIKTEPTTVVLLVDDEQDIRDVLKVALADAGHSVLTAQNGRQALELFLEHRPPIVITDIKMPVMDGIELLKKIKRDIPDTEVIMITGHGDMDLAVESLKHQAADFITKPINVDALDIAMQRARERVVMRRQLQDYMTHLEALIREKSELQNHLSSLGLMIGSISHGIKGLLTGLDGGMYILEKGLYSENKDKVDEGWQTVKLMVGRIRKMIMDILFYSKSRQLQQERVDLKNFAEEVARTAAQRLDACGITLDSHIDMPNTLCTIDTGYLHAALMNLFENAIDACRDAGGDVGPCIGFSAVVDKAEMVFTVSDNGVGMDDQTLDHLFTLFFSAKDRRGTGLGLFVTKNIVDQHGGTIQVSSSPGRGSRFTVRLPIA